MAARHIADAESEFHVLNITPDFCDVDGCVVPFDISQTLEPEKADYAPTLHARGVRVLHEKSVIRGVEGNEGRGVASTVSQGGGDVHMKQGTDHFLFEGKRVCRHLDLCQMNVKS
jgi:hypothetical protein